MSRNSVKWGDANGRKPKEGTSNDDVPPWGEKDDKFVADYLENPDHDDI